MGKKLVVVRDLATEVNADLRWYALVVPPQKEYVAAYIIHRHHGIETFIPTETRWRFQNRYAKARKKKEEYAFPVVPRMLFAGFVGEPDWYRLFNMPIITGVVGMDGSPRMLSRTEFAKFAGMHANGTLRAPPEQRHMRSREEFRVDDTVSIVDGPFRDHEAKVIEITGHMAKVLLPLFGVDREIPVELDRLSLVA